MKYAEAVTMLRMSINGQKTITTKKLKEILMSMNISLDPEKENPEIAFLKNENKRLTKDNQILRKKVKKLRG